MGTMKHFKRPEIKCKHILFLFEVLLNHKVSILKSFFFPKIELCDFSDASPSELFTSFDHIPCLLIHSCEQSYAMYHCYKFHVYCQPFRRCRRLKICILKSKSIFSFSPRHNQDRNFWIVKLKWQIILTFSILNRFYIKNRSSYDFCKLPKSGVLFYK